MRLCAKLFLYPALIVTFLLIPESGLTQQKPQEDFLYTLWFAGGLNASTVLDLHSSPKKTSQLPMARGLISSINNAQSSIDFAIYGIRNQCAVIDALENAIRRGVKVRGLIDQNSNSTYDYRDANGCDTEALVKRLGQSIVKNDINPRTGKAYSYIMHNKFFIFDQQNVHTGSTNVSDTGMGGEYSANWAIEINSSNLAKVYTKEFEEMWVLRLTHRKKSDNTTHILPIYSDGTIIESYFSPSDSTMQRAILPAINRAKSTIKIAIFFLTSPEITNALLLAEQRGISVSVIIDALGAANRSSGHRELCHAGIPVKIENWNGKMHMKSMLVDDHEVIIGSQNFTKSGNKVNDENTLLLRGPGVKNIAKDYQTYFNNLWDSIPNRFTCYNPRAESTNSGTTCSDGIDNDYDGDIDQNDNGC